MTSMNTANILQDFQIEKQNQIITFCLKRNTKDRSLFDIYQVNAKYDEIKVLSEGLTFDKASAIVEALNQDEVTEPN